MRTKNWLEKKVVEVQLAPETCFQLVDKCRLSSGRIKHVLEIIKAAVEVYAVLMPHGQIWFSQHTGRVSNWLSSGPARALFPLLLSCHVRMSQISSCLFMPAPEPRRTNKRTGDAAGLGLQTHGKIQLLPGLLPLKHTHVLSYGEITHLQHHIANSAHNEDRGQSDTHTGTYTHRHKKHDRPGKRPGSLSIPETELGQNLSLSLCLCFFSVHLWLVRWHLTGRTESRKPLPGWERIQSSSPDNHRALHSLLNPLPFSLQPAKTRDRSKGEEQLTPN